MPLSSQRTLGSFLAVALAATPVQADEIHLRGGGRVSGRIVERTETRVAIETGPGRVTLPMSRVERIVEGRSALEAFAERASRLDASDVGGWAELARWAEDRELLTQARLAWQRVLAADPRHPQANAALGRVSLDGVWMAADDAYRARGYVWFDGRWLTPAEHEAAVREQAADRVAALEAREADLRLREAEARAREAEARARDAETEARSASTGIPLGYGYGFGYGYGVGGIAVVPPLGPHPLAPSELRDRGRRHPHPGSASVEPTPAPPPPPPARPATSTTRRATPRQAGILPPQPRPQR